MMNDTEQFAGFWRRVGARIIDNILIGIVNFGIQRAMGIPMVASHASMSSELGGKILMAFWIGLGIAVFYHTLFESSELQATPGKMLLGIVVTDSDGQRCSFLQAFGRACGYYLSALLLCIGFIMCAFTERKQCLHDLMASCLVVKNDAPIRRLAMRR